MRLVVKNVGLLKEADVTVDGITVIVAPNDTGKSTVAKSLYIALDIMNRYDEHYDEDYESFLQEKVRDIRNIVIRGEGDLLEEDVYRLQKFWRWGREKGDEIRIVLKNIYEKGNLSRRNKDIIEKILNEIESVPSREDNRDKLVRSLLRRYSYPVKNDFKVCISDDNKEVFSLDSNHVKWGYLLTQDVFYTDNPMRLEIVNSSVPVARPLRPRREVQGGDYLGNRIMQSIAKLISGEDNFDNSFRDDIEKQIEFTKSIRDIVGGRFEVRSGRTLVFNRNNEDIKLTNTATGIKAFAYLQLILDNYLANEKTLLILDEPEVNLHPVWQVKYVELLVRMHKELGVKIYINTHSTYVVEAIRLYAEYYDVEDVTHFYAITDGRTKEVTRRLEFIYEELNGSYELMDSIADKILERREER